MIQLDPVMIGASGQGETDQERRDREARAAAAAALRDLQDIPAGASTSGFQPRQPPAQPPPGELQMPPGADDVAPNAGTREHARRTVEFNRDVAANPPTAADTRVPPGLPTLAQIASRQVPPQARAAARMAGADASAALGGPMARDAVVSRPGAPMDAPARPQFRGDPAMAQPRGAQGLGTPTPPGPQGPPMPPQPRPVAPETARTPYRGPGVIAGPQKPAQAPAVPPQSSNGLPSEGDISRAEGTDVLRRIFGGIGRGLVAASGRAPSQFRPEADQLRQRREQGLTRQAATQQAAQRREQSDGIARERLELERRRTESAEERNRRTDERLDRGLDMRGEAAEVNSEFRQERTARERIAAAREEAMRSPSSPETIRRRGAEVLRVMADQRNLPEAQRMSREEVEAIYAPLSAYEIDRMNDIDGAGGASRGRARTHGAGGGRPAPAGIAAAGAAQVSDLVQSGALTAEVGEALSADLASPNARTRAEAQRVLDDLRPQRGRGTIGQGTELIPGSGIRAGGDLATGEDRAWRQGYASAQRSMGGLRRVDAIAQRFGRSGAINPEARAQIVPELALLRSMVAQMGGTGVINPSEVPTINAALPNPADLEQSTFQTFGARMAQWRQILEDGVQAQAASLGVDEEGTRRLVQGLRAGSVAPRGGSGGEGAPAATQAPTRRLIGPDGRPRAATPEQIERYSRPGARLPEGWRLEGGS